MIKHFRTNRNSKPIKQEVKTNTKTDKPKLERHDVLFDLDHLKNLLYSKNFIVDVPNYLNKFFFRYGNDIFYDNGETYELLSREEAKNKIPDQYKKSVIITTKDGKEKSIDMSLKSYFGHELFLKTYETKLTINYKKEFKFVDSQYIKGFEVKYNYLNMKKELPRNYDRKIQLTEENKKGVKMFFDHIKTIICSGDEEEYNTTIKFFASSCVGHKVKFALLWQSKEQTGKGTILNYMNDLLGKRMVKTSSVENVERYTKIFEGASLINLDELPVSGTSKTLQDTMKALITEPKFDCRAMFNQAYSQDNTFNFVITSNNNCISLTQTNQIRYYVNTINESYIGNKKYFDDLHKVINNEDIKILIFQEFIKIYEEQVKPNNWIGNDLKPTKAGQIKRIEALPPFYKWIKETYLINGLGINETFNEISLNYKSFNRNDKTSDNKLARYLQDLGVKVKDIKKTQNGKQVRECRKYILSFEDLKKVYEDKKWLDELIDEIPDEEEDEKPDPFENGVKSNNDIIKEKDKEIKELKDKLKEMEEQIKLLTQPKINPLDEGINEIKSNNKLDGNIDEFIVEEDKRFDDDLKLFDNLLNPSNDDLNDETLNKIENGELEKEIKQTNKKPKSKVKQNKSKSNKNVITKKIIESKALTSDDEMSDDDF